MDFYSDPNKVNELQHSENMDYVTFLIAQQNNFDTNNTDTEMFSATSEDIDSIDNLSATSDNNVTITQKKIEQSPNTNRLENEIKKIFDKAKEYTDKLFKNIDNKNTVSTTTTVNENLKKFMGGKFNNNDTEYSATSSGNIVTDNMTSDSVLSDNTNRIDYRNNDSDMYTGNTAPDNNQYTSQFRTTNNGSFTGNPTTDGTMSYYTGSNPKKYNKNDIYRDDDNNYNSSEYNVHNYKTNRTNGSYSGRETYRYTNNLNNSNSSGNSKSNSNADSRNKYMDQYTNNLNNHSTNANNVTRGRYSGDNVSDNNYDFVLTSSDNGNTYKFDNSNTNQSGGAKHSYSGNDSTNKSNYNSNATDTTTTKKRKLPQKIIYFTEIAKQIRATNKYPDVNFPSMLKVAKFIWQDAEKNVGSDDQAAVLEEAKNLAKNPDKYVEQMKNSKTDSKVSTNNVTNMPNVSKKSNYRFKNSLN